jgi:hypothetical protein
MRRLDSIDAIDANVDVGAAGQQLWRTADRGGEQGRWNSQVELTPQFSGSASRLLCRWICAPTGR